MSHGIQHSVTVHASSVFEAAGLGVKHVREQQMLDDDSSFGETLWRSAREPLWVIKTNLSRIALTM